MIDRSGAFWKGEDFADLSELLVAWTRSNKTPADRVLEVRCECGGFEFTLQIDDESGVARRTCTSCGMVAFIADSGDYWDDAEPGGAQCPCAAETFALAVAYTLRDDGDIRWITVGGRCTACGTLGAYTDWKIDFSPTDHLFERS